VDPIGPDVHVVPLTEIAAAKRLMVGLPGGDQTRDDRRRQPRRRAEERLQRGHEVAGGQPVQVQQRQHLSHLGTLAAPGRQDHRPEPHPLTAHRVGPAVVHPRRPHRDHPRRGRDRALAGLAVAHHQPPASLVPLDRVRGEIRIDLGLQRGGQHPPGALAHDRIQVQAQLVLRLGIGDYTQHAAFLPRRRSPRRRSQDLSSGKVRRAHISRPDPQLQVIPPAAGFIIAAELLIIFSPGTADDKRVLLSTWVKYLFGLKLNPFVVIAIILFILILAYVLGYLTRLLFISAIARFQALVSNTYRIVNYRRFHRDSRSDPTHPRHSPLWLSRFDRSLRFILSIFSPQPSRPADSYDLHKDSDCLRLLLSSFSTPSLSATDMWRMLTSSFEEDKVVRALARHPIVIKPDEPDFTVTNSYLYAFYWLKRYAADLFSEDMFTRIGLRFDAIAPVLLAPFVIVALRGPGRSSEFTLYLLLAIIAAIWMYRSTARTSMNLSPLMFQFFVIAQLLEDGRPQSPPTSAEAIDESRKPENTPASENQR
jgi:hypothetical protein